RRFSVPMQEIWLLQPRFALRQRKRVHRLLAHPRFRAAYDFLVLRQVASDEHAEDVEFWRELQTHPEAIEEALQAAAAESRDGGSPGEGDAPRKRRRRRRRAGGDGNPSPAPGGA
ncbi:MAG TPA: polynucleotide adenylyltransferase PcnB, partial [Xanthomonadaceae bacterium]|nr:polynucleotide adenylyltransferase PcnB [Xanthomonadaceae bacterium]